MYMIWSRVTITNRESRSFKRFWDGNPISCKQPSNTPFIAWKPLSHLHAFNIPRVDCHQIPRFHQCRHNRYTVTYQRFRAWMCNAELTKTHEFNSQIIIWSSMRVTPFDTKEGRQLLCRIMKNRTKRPVKYLATKRVNIYGDVTRSSEHAMTLLPEI